MACRKIRDNETRRLTNLIFRSTLDISSRFFLALLWVPNLLFATFNALLSLPTFKSSVILFSQGAKPATSRIIFLTKCTLLLVFCMGQNNCEHQDKARQHNQCFQLIRKPFIHQNDKKFSIDNDQFCLYSTFNRGQQQIYQDLER